jgi:signal transduction histidine kinase
MAADCGQGINHFQHTDWTLADGAPPDIWALAQSADGYLWLGTGAGLYRFDGVRFEQIRPQGSAALAGVDITALLARKSGELWIGYQSGGVSVLREGKLTNFTAGVPKGPVHQFAEDQDQRLWMTSDSGVAQFSAGQWHLLGSNWKSPPPAANSLSVSRDGTLWVTTSWGKSFRQDGSQLVFLQRGSNRFQVSTEPVPTAAAIAQAPDGRLWVSDADRGARQLPEFPLPESRQPPLDEPPTAWSFRPLSLVFDNEGALWGTDSAGGLFRLQLQPHCFGPNSPAGQPMIERPASHSGLASPIAASLLKDAEGNIWVGTNLGLDRFRAANVVVETGVPTNSPEGYRGTRGTDGDFFVTSGRSLYRIRHGGESQEILRAPQSISFTYTGRDGAIWLGSQGGLMRLAHDEWQKIDLPEVASSHSVWKFEQDARGSLWVAIWGAGIFHRDSDKWKKFDIGAGLDTVAPALMSTDTQGRKWLYYQGGPLVLVDGPSVRVMTAAEAPQLGTIQTIVPTPREVLLAGDLGLARYIADHFETLSASDHPHLARISGIVQTSQGETWMNGITGLVRMRTRDLESAFAHSQQDFRYELFDFRDGLPGPALQDSREPTAAEGSDGRLWFITNRGVAWVDPTRLTRNPVAPPVVIRSVRANGVDYPFAPHLVLPRGTSDLQIDYTALSLSIPERVRFQYRLEGSDKAWIDPAERRQAFYTRLGPGDYHFQVRAANNDGVWNTVGASLQLTIAPTFVQSRPFWILCLLAALLVLWLLYSMRLRQISARLSDRSEARLAERERIARDLHDTLLQGFQGLILRFQAVANRLPPGAHGREMINEVLERADDVIIEGRDRVRSLRSVHSDVHLADIFSTSAQRLGLEPAIKFDLTVEGSAHDLDPTVVDEIANIGNEALFNSFRHAQATRVGVTIAYAPRTLRVLFSDDGVGIDPEILVMGNREDHFGLTGMRERAKRIHATFSLRSQPGAGTLIEVTVPAAVAYTDARHRRYGFMRSRVLISEE